MNKSVVVFLSVFAGFFGYLHFVVASILTDHFTKMAWPVCSVFAVGFITTFLGYYVASRKPKSSVYFIAWTGYIWMGTFFIALWVSLVAALVELVFQTPDLSLAALVTSIGLAAYSLFQGLRKPVVVTEQVKGPVGVKGLRMVQITDLHVGLLNHDEKWLKHVVQLVNEVQADFIFLTGDLVEGSPQFVKDQLGPLSEAKAKIAKIYISGNHEMIHGGMIWEQEMPRHGFKVLHNSHHVYQKGEAKILVAGVPDRMVRRFDPRFESNPEKALSGAEPVDFKVLLAHEPSSVADLKTQKVDLLLAGHTHGGQIFPFQIFVRMVQPVVKGWKTLHGIPVYAHVGTGLWGPPMRLGTRNEIVVFELV